MAPKSAIGSLFVALGLDTAQFDVGLKKSQAGLAAFGKTAAAGFAVASAAAIAAGAALGVLTKNAINYADAIDEASQKTGVTAEALSRLAYTAKVEGVGLDGLTAGLTRLSRSMADVASGSSGPAATAFQALSISVTDVSGKLRSADEVFVDIADRLGRMEEGSTKSALAMQLFGKSGTELIPILNYGADGLGRMADESDRYGQTISTATAAAAGEFNETMTKTGLVIEGVGLKVAESALPGLQSLASELASPNFASAAQGLATVVVGALNLIVAGAANAADNIRMLRDVFSSVEGMSTDGLNGRLRELGLKRVELENLIISSQGKLNRGDDLFGLNRGALEAQIAQSKADMDALTEQERVILNILKERKDLQGGVATPAAAATFDLPTFTDTGAAEAAASRLESLRQSLMTEEQLEMDSHLKRLDEIRGFYESGAILRGEYDAMLETAQEQHAERMTAIAKEQAEEEARIRETLVGNVADIFGSLGALAESMGEKNLGVAKAFGVAEAVINTAQGVTKALAQGGLLGFAGAAAVAAAGAAQISTILSARKGTGSTPSVKGGAPSASPSSEAAGPAASQTVNVTLQGQSYGRDQIRDLLEQIGGALGDGMVLKVAAP